MHDIFTVAVSHFEVPEKGTVLNWIELNSKKWANQSSRCIALIIDKRETSQTNGCCMVFAINHSIPRLRLRPEEAFLPLLPPRMKIES